MNFNKFVSFILQENKERKKYRVTFDGSRYETTSPSSAGAITQVLAKIARNELKPELVPSFIAKNKNKAKAVLLEQNNFNPEQLKIGIEVELEHTSDRNIAKKIAMDHLKEDPRYYTKLKKAGL